MKKYLNKVKIVESCDSIISEILILIAASHVLIIAIAIADQNKAIFKIGISCRYM